VIISSAVLVDRERQRLLALSAANTPKSKTFLAATLARHPSVLLEILGALAATATTKTLDIQGLGIPQAFPDWFVLPFLLLAIVQLFAINTMICTRPALPSRRSVCRQAMGAVVIDTVIVAIVTALVLFHGDFYHDLTGFFLYIVVWLGPWFGILIVDYWLRRGRYDANSLSAPAVACTGERAASTGRPSSPRGSG